MGRTDRLHAVRFDGSVPDGPRTDATRCGAPSIGGDPSGRAFRCRRRSRGGSAGESPRASVRGGLASVGTARRPRASGRLRTGLARIPALRNAREGWWQEYDGADPGYLSATVSFLGKLYQRKPSPEIVGLAREAIEFASHFAYPDGHYAGNMGSRQTLHFYPHGVEIFADQIPLAGRSLSGCKRVWLSGRWYRPRSSRAVHALAPGRVFARVPGRATAQRDPTVLPYEGPSFHRWYPEAGIDVRRAHDMYALVNLAKGGVIKVFNTEQRRQVLSDCGIAGRLADGRMVTSQWIDPRYRIGPGEHELTIAGWLQQMSSMSSFTPAKLVAFRAMLTTVGRSARASHAIKGAIRRALMLGTKAVPLAFQRRICFEPGYVTIADEIRRVGDVKVQGLITGDEVAVRYVPQSRFFQLPELDTYGYTLTPDDLATLHAADRIRITRRVEVATGQVDVSVGDRLLAACTRTTVAGPAGVGA